MFECLLIVLGDYVTEAESMLLTSVKFEERG